MEMPWRSRGLGRVPLEWGDTCSEAAKCKLAGRMAPAVEQLYADCSADPGEGVLPVMYCLGGTPWESSSRELAPLVGLASSVESRGAGGSSGDSRWDWGSSSGKCHVVGAGTSRERRWSGGGEKRAVPRPGSLGSGAAARLQSCAAGVYAGAGELSPCEDCCERTAYAEEGSDTGCWGATGRRPVCMLVGKAAMGGGGDELACC